MWRFLIIPLIFVLLDIYAYQGVRTITAESSVVVKRVTRSIYWVSCIAIYVCLGFMMSRQMQMLPPALISFLVGLFVVAFGFKLFAIIPLLIEDVYRVGEWIIRFFRPSGSAETETGQGLVSRKTFLSQVAVGLGSIPFLSLTYGIVRGAHDYKIHRQKIVLKNLPPSFNGLKIVQISDIHSGSFWSKSSVAKGIQMLLDEKPDLVFFTGDLVNNHHTEMEPYLDLFSSIKAPMGVYSILGNHDYGEYTDPRPNREQVRENAKAVADIHRVLGWDILMNEHRVLQRGEDKIALIGIENFGLGFQQYGRLDLAYKGAEDYPVKLLLSHDPSHWRHQVLADYRDIDVAFAGHTHGMQLGIETAGWKWSPIKYRYPEWAGLYQEGEQFLYVNRGFGYLGYPGRLGIRPEISVIELHNA